MGVHDARIPGVDLALFDVVGTAALIAATSIYGRVPVWLSIGAWLVAAVVLHTAFRVPVRVLAV